MEAPANVAPAPAPSVSVVAQLISVSKISMVFICAVAFTPVASLGLMILSVYKGRERINGKILAAVKDKYKGSLYEKVQLYESSQDKVRAGSAVVRCRLGCVLLLWMVMPTPSPHRNWSVLAAFVVLSHPFIALTLAAYVHMSHQYLVEPRSQLHYYSYYIWDGLFDSLVYLLHVASVFLLWMFYFHAQVGLNAGFDKYATRTLLALLVAALLWVLKTALLLRWKQKAVYEKFRPRILMSTFRLWNLCFFFDGKARYDLFPSGFLKVNNEWEEQKYLESSSFSTRNAREYIVSAAHVSLNQVKEAVEILSLLTKISTPRSVADPHQLSAIHDAYRQKIATTFSDPNEATTESIIKGIGMRESWRILLEDVLQMEYPCKDLNKVPFDLWVVEAHKSCLSVSYTLTDAFAMVRELDTILTSCLVMAVIVVWLLAIELVSTTMLVVIASPFLALNFVFGDVCKNFFQGFIFAFITHPFDIGDRCIINEVEVEVKRVSTMTTTCMKMGTNEQMLYPNSNLAANLIINLGDKLDPNDVIELILHPGTKMIDILDMKKHIENFIYSDEQRVLFEKEHKVVVKEIRNGIKIIVSFQHIVDGRDVSFSEFFEKKEGQRSTLFIKIKKFLENLGVEVATL